MDFRGFWGPGRALTLIIWFRFLRYAPHHEKSLLPAWEGSAEVDRHTSQQNSAYKRLIQKLLVAFLCREILGGKNKLNVHVRLFW